jgi:hypothetical protein
LPLPVDAVTIHDVPEPVTFVISGEPPKPVFTSVKFDAVTPVTGSLKVTSHCTLDAFVGDGVCRLIEETVGGVLSTVTALLPVEVELPRSSIWLADSV